MLGSNASNVTGAVQWQRYFDLSGDESNVMIAGGLARRRARHEAETGWKVLGADVLGHPAPLLDRLGRQPDILGVDQAEADVGHQVEPALGVEQAGGGLDRQPGVGTDGQVFGDAPDPRRSFELDVDPLGPVLEEPLAL